MPNKKRYYGLDEIGFLGTQDKRTAAQVKRDIEVTVQYIKANKPTKVIDLPQKRKKRLAKAK